MAKKKEDTIESVLEHAIRDTDSGFSFEEECEVRVKFLPKKELRTTIEESRYGDSDIHTLLPDQEIDIDTFVDKVGNKSFTGRLGSYGDGYRLSLPKKKDQTNSTIIYFFPGNLQEVEIEFEPTVVYVPSLHYELILKKEHMEVECQEVTREDVFKMFKAVGEWLGYDIK